MTLGFLFAPADKAIYFCLFIFPFVIWRAARSQQAREEEEKEAKRLASDKRAMELEVIKSNQKAKQKVNRVEKTRTSFDEHRFKV